MLRDRQGRFPYEVLAKYPHMLPADIELWERFVRTYPKRFDSVDYDVHLGRGVRLDETWPENIKKMAVTLSQKRVDAVGYSGGAATIIEVKPNAGLTAVGQVLGYWKLFPEKYPDVPVAGKMIVTNGENWDTLKLCKDFDIELVVV